MLRSTSKRLLKFLKRILVTQMWVREYSKTVCPSGSYMLLIRKGKKQMAEEGDWIYNIIPAEQVDSMTENMEKIEKRSKSGVTIIMSASDESAVEMCRTWQEALQGNSFAWIKISSFVSGIISTIEEHLEEEGINPYES